VLISEFKSGISYQKACVACQVLSIILSLPSTQRAARTGQPSHHFRHDTASLAYLLHQSPQTPPLAGMAQHVQNKSLSRHMTMIISR
jgi:hypothetical protein